jgi:hypothetical protein
MWINPTQAVQLLTGALRWPTGRYAPNIDDAVNMVDVAHAKYPGRPVSVIPPRRGDRPVERLVAEYEWAEPWMAGSVRIFHPADARVRAPLSEPA